METSLLSGLLGILGGIVSGLIVSILSQRKNNAEIKRLEAETRKINLEMETVSNNWYRELLSELHSHMHLAVGTASHMTRPVRESPILAGKPDEEIVGLLDESFTVFEIKQILRAGDRDAYFNDLIAWHEYVKAEKAKADFHNYIVAKNLLIDDEELLQTCAQLDVLLDEVLNITRLNIRKIAPGNLIEVQRKFNNNVGSLVKKIEALIKPELKPNRH
jgi:hypothetical protein